MKMERLAAKDTAWYGQPVYRVTGTLADLPSALPTFRRAGFAYEGALNEYHDVILREPHEEDDRLVPVATVSKRYVLIQHRDLVQWVSTAVTEQNWAADEITVSAHLSEYGERLFVRITMPSVSVEVQEGDVIGAEIRLWNSVDKSRAMEIAIGWRRLICSNGLSVWAKDRLRKIHHVDWFAGESPLEFLRDRLPASRRSVEALSRWRECAVGEKALVSWADTTLAQAWGKGRAARVLHICRTGHDCSVGRHAAGKEASELTVERRMAVPGAPARTANVYDLYQALLWVAGQERALEDREAKTQDALELVRPLLPPALQAAAR